MSIRVLICDDQALVRAGFRAILGSRPEIEIVGEAENGAEAVALAERRRPDVILMDIRMPVLDGVEATRRLVAEGSPARILVLTTFDLDEYVHAAIRAGASGFLLKDVTPAKLVEAIRIVAGGDALLAPSVTRRLLERFAATLPPGDQSSEVLGQLTARETEVLRLLAGGLSNAEIASELVVSEATVKTHISSLLRKLGLRDRVQAVILAYETGLVTPRQGVGPEPSSRRRDCRVNAWIPEAGASRTDRCLGARRRPTRSLCRLTSPIPETITSVEGWSSS